jgi:SEL1 protein
MMGAEQGYEAGQANVAHLLDEQKSSLALDRYLPIRRPRCYLTRNPELAMIYWTRSAKQINFDSMVKVGDYHLAGIGTEADAVKAATCYQTAADSHVSAQAHWNIGWMHENGIGLEQDFHLAKRHYDWALEVNREAYLPVSLSLLKLRARSYWNLITNGRVNSIRDEPGKTRSLFYFRRRLQLSNRAEAKKEWSFREWIHQFVQDDHAPYDDYDDEDPTNAIHEGILGGEDMYDEAIDDGLLESFVIVGLAAALAFLIYYRQQRQLRHQREAGEVPAGTQPRPPLPPQGQATNLQQEPAQAAPDGGGVQQQQPQPQQQDRGFFPQPGDPEYGQWVAGGIMH